MRLPSPRRRTVKIIGAGQREEFRGLRYTAEADIPATDTVKLGEFTVGHIEFGPSLASGTYGAPIKPVATLSDRDLLMDVAADNLERAEKAEAELAQSREREAMAETTRDIWHRNALSNSALTVTAREERDHARFIAGRLAIEKRHLDIEVNWWRDTNVSLLKILGEDIAVIDGLKAALKAANDDLHALIEVDD